MAKSKWEAAAEAFTHHENPYNNAAYCAFCTGAFKRSDTIVKWLGEYPVHIECKEGYTGE